MFTIKKPNTILASPESNSENQHMFCNLFCVFDALFLPENADFNGVNNQCGKRLITKLKTRILLFRTQKLLKTLAIRHLKRE